MSVLASVKDWGPEAWVLVIGAASAALVAIIKAFQSGAKVDAVTQRVDSIARSQDSIRSDMLVVAKDQQPPSPAASVPPPSSVSTNPPSLVNPGGIHHPPSGHTGVTTLPFTDKPKG